MDDWIFSILHTTTYHLVVLCAVKESNKRYYMNSNFTDCHRKLTAQGIYFIPEQCTMI
jgi:hypothetical protein